MNEKGEIRLKQKILMAARDHYLTMSDLGEIRENFVWGIGKYLVLEGNMEPGIPHALDYMEMFHKFFSTIAARPNLNQD